MQQAVVAPGSFMMLGPTTTSIAAGTDKQLDVTFRSDEQDLTTMEHHLHQYPSYIENNNNQQQESLSACASAEGLKGSSQLASANFTKAGKVGRNEGNYLKNQRSSPVQEESVEEEPEFDSLVGDSVQEFEKAKQRLIEMEKRYNTITFKQKKQLKKKAMNEKYTNFNQNATMQDWKKPLLIPKSITSYEEDETQFNFQSTQKYHSPKNGQGKNRISVFTSAQKNRTASEGILPTKQDGSFRKTAADGFRNLSKLTDMKNENHNSSSIPRATTSSKLANIRVMQMQTPQIHSIDKFSPASGGLLGKTHQFSTLEQAKKFRQRSLLDAATKESQKLKSSVTDANCGTDTADTGTVTSPKQGGGVLFKGVPSAKTLLPIPRAQTSHANAQSQAWAEEQRLKKFLKEFEEVEFSFQNSTEDPLQKIKKQMNFLRDRAVKFITPLCPSEVLEIFDRSINNILYFNDKRLSYFRNELKFYQMEKEKHVVMIEERDALIAVYKERDLSEEEKRKMAWKHRQARNDKMSKFDESIEELFTYEALAVKKIEQPYIISQGEEERDREDEERTMNFRRMNWLEKDMDLMMRLINLDVSETLKQHAQMNVDGMLTVVGEHLKEGVGLGIQNQIANFHIRIEEILKENQKLLKAKAPEKIDRCYQTENWNMERYLDELESLKRQRWILDKENKESKEKLDNNRERIKRLKDDLARFIKKVQTMESKEKMIDQIMQEKDKQIADLKQDHHLAIGQYVKKDIEKTKEIRSLNERYEMLNIAKITREVDLMKKEEEMNKKLDAMEKKVQEAKSAVSYFQKLLGQKNSELESTKDMLEMQLKFQAILEDEESNDPDTAKSRGKKKKKVGITEDQSQSSKRGIAQSTSRNGGDLTQKNTLSSISKTSPKGDGSASSPGAVDGLKNAQNPLTIQTDGSNTQVTGDFLAVPEKRSPKAILKKMDDVTIPISSNSQKTPSIGIQQNHQSSSGVVLETIIESVTPLESMTPHQVKSQNFDEKVKSMSIIKEDNPNHQGDQLAIDGNGEATPISMGAKSLNKSQHVSQKLSSDSVPRTETFNPFQTINGEPSQEALAQQQILKKSSLLRSLADKAKSISTPHSLTNKMNMLITTEDIGIQVELIQSSSNDMIAKVMSRPSFRLMLPQNKPQGITTATQTVDYQEPVAKPKALKLGEEPQRKTSPFQGQRIKGTVSVLLKSSMPSKPSISSSGQLAPVQKSAPDSDDGVSPPPRPPPVKNINQASTDFMDSLQQQIDILKSHEAMKAKPLSRGKSPPLPISRTEGFQRRTIIEDDDNVLKGKTVMFSQSGNSRPQSPEEVEEVKTETIKKQAKPEKTIDFSSANLKSRKQTSQPPSKPSSSQLELQQAKPDSSKEEIKPKPDSSQSIKPKSDSSQQIKPKPDSSQSIKPKPDSSQAIKQMPESSQEIKLSAQSSQKPQNSSLAKKHPQSLPQTIKEAADEHNCSTQELPPATSVDSATASVVAQPLKSGKQSSTIKKGIETALNSLAQVSKHAKYARNAAGILENMLNLKQKEQTGSTEESIPSLEDTQKQRVKSNKGPKSQRNGSTESREEQKKGADGALEINTTMDREGRSRTKKEAMEFDERTSQELAIMEYYMNMKPEKPFNAMVVGHRASLQHIVLSPDRSRSRSQSPKRQSMTKKETGYDDQDRETLHQLEEQLQRKKTTVLMKKDGRETMTPIVTLYPSPNPNSTQQLPPK